MKPLRVLVIVAILALLAQTFGAAPAYAQAKIIKIASQSPLSGGQSLLGTGMRNATELAINQLKKPIEDMGFQVQFVPYDDQATANVGVSNAQNIVNDAAIMAVIGHFNSGVAIPSSEVYVKSDLVMVSPANTGVNVTDRGLPTVNRVCGRDDAQGQVGADYATNTMKAKTVYILHDKTVYGQGVAQAFNDAVKKAGIEVLGFEGTEEKSNFDAIITPIQAQNPDLIYFGGIYDQAAVFWKQAHEKGVKATFMGPDGMDSPDLVKIAGDAVVGMVYTSAAGPATAHAEAKKFIDDYKAAYGSDPTPYAAEAYASTQVVMAAIQTVLKDNGGAMPTRKAISAAVRASKGVATIIGSITFDANGDRDFATYYILKVVSPDPNKWVTPGNEVSGQVTLPSPLTAKAGGTPPAMAGATAEATAAK
jgi:branched-chain amino acid transport system substrate-binding protein